MTGKTTEKVTKRNNKVRVRNLLPVKVDETIEEESVKDYFYGSKNSVNASKENKQKYHLDNSDPVPLPDTTYYVYDANQTKQEVNFLKPPFNPEALIKLVNASATLQSCISCMTTNVESHGYAFEYIGPETKKDKEAAKKELEKGKFRLEYINPEYSYTELRQRVRRDLETFGYAFMEVVRNRNGIISELYHVQAETTIISTHHPEPQEVLKTLYEGSTKRVKASQRKFRVFRQGEGKSKVYFKEFGDPRRLNMLTGEFNESISDSESASELVYFKLYASGYAYGMPRWTGAMMSVLGSREADLTNLEFFTFGGIPACAVLVNGGALNEESFDLIQSAFRPGRKRESVHRVVVLEASGDEDASSSAGVIPPPSIKIEQLADQRQSDALFVQYDESNQKKIRKCFRLPALILGQSEDTTYATAEASMILAESQIFSPERRLLDDFFNFHVLGDGEAPLRYWKLKSNPARLINPDSLSKALKAFSSVGALTPNIAIDIMNKMLDLQIEKVNEEWGDMPYDFSKILVALGRLLGIENIEKSPDQIAALNNALAGNTGKGNDAALGTANNLGSSNPTNAAREDSNKQKSVLDNLSLLKLTVDFDE